MLAQQLRGEIPSGTRVQIDIVAAAPGYAATIVVRADEASAPRTITAGDCDALARAAILVVAVAIDPIAVVGPVDPVDDGDAAIALPPPIVRDEATERRMTRSAGRGPTSTAPSASRPRAPWHHGLGLGGAIGSQIVPTLTGAVQLAYVAAHERWRIESHASWIPPVARRYDDGAGARLQAFTLGVRGCPSPALGRVTLAVCVGVVGGPVLGHGTGVPRGTRATSGWVAAQVGVAAIIAVHARLGVLIGVDGFASLLRPAFHVGARADVLDAPILGGRGVLGLEVRLR